ncbi:MAG: hypothetical protein ACJ766_13140 [Thermoleophilaceae bacterium]
MLLVAAGCGGGSDSKVAKEPSDPAAKPPHGWRTLSNREAGFTLSLPKSWTARVKGTASVIRSKDRLLVITVAADRGEQGRELSASDYARRTLDALPDFEGSVLPRARRVRGSPYRSARVDGTGTLKTSKRLQGITVATFQRHGEVTYALVAFFNPKLPESFYEPKLRRILRSFRAQRPRAK